jgi:hypothetical protein
MEPQMDAADRKHLTDDCEVLKAMLSRWIEITRRIETERELGFTNFALDGLSDARFYIARVLEMPRDHIDA